MEIIRARRASDDLTFIPIAFIQNTDISGAAKLVYASAASHRQAGEPDPGTATIAKETGLSPKKVEAGIKELNDLSDDEWKRLGL